VVPFHSTLIAAFAAGVFGVNINASNAGLSATRLPAAADEWAHFRVRSLSFRLHPVPTTSNTQAAGFVGGAQDTPPGTIGQVGELLPSVPLTQGTTVPSAWVHVSRSEMAGPLPWYKTTLGTADATEESPGAIFVIGTGTELFNLEIKGVFEFKTAVATGNTPAALSAIRQLRNERLRVVADAERLRLLKVLQGGGVTAGAAWSLCPK